MKVLAITQARTGSTRLPGKVLKQVNGKTLLAIHLQRILKSKRIDGLLVATTVEKADDAIEDAVKQLNLPFYRGSLNDVLDRFYQAALPHQPDWVVRLTSDCPLMDPVLIDEIIKKAMELDVDYCSNTLTPSFPDGIDIEVFKFSALEKAWKEATLVSDREHVTPYIHQNSDHFKKGLFTSYNYSCPTDYSGVRLTVDEPMDFEVIRRLIEKMGDEMDWKTFADYYLSDPAISTMNKNILRNEGYINSLKK